jgi:hypothetical protein
LREVRATTRTETLLYKELDTDISTEGVAKVSRACGEDHRVSRAPDPYEAVSGIAYQRPSTATRPLCAFLLLRREVV